MLASSYWQTVTEIINNIIDPAKMYGNTEFNFCIIHVARLLRQSLLFT